VIAGLSMPKWFTNQRSQEQEMERNAFYMKETALAQYGAGTDLK